MPLREELATRTPVPSPGVLNQSSGGKVLNIILLEDHPLWHPHASVLAAEPAADDDGSTFELGLTAQQKLDRERVVLHYFDAQVESYMKWELKMISTRRRMRFKENESWRRFIRQV